MYDGHNGRRYPDTDPNQLGKPFRERNQREDEFHTELGVLEGKMRDLLTTFGKEEPGAGREVATALTKLDELVLWAKRGINR